MGRVMDPTQTPDAARADLVARFLELTEGILGSSPNDEWVDLLNGLELADLTKPQLVALLYLRRGATRMSDIAAHLRVSLSSATSLVDRLAAKGLVERLHDEVDRRQVLCRLTALGLERVEAMWSSGRRQFGDVAEHLSLDDLRTVVAAMEILAGGARRAAAARS